MHSGRWSQDWGMGDGLDPAGGRPADHSRDKEERAVLAAALCVDLVLCNRILKPAIARVRPFDVNTAVRLLIPKPGDFSFPSGHTAASFTAAAALWFAGEKKLWKPALVLASFIAFSRLYLYVHYPTDILGEHGDGGHCRVYGLRHCEALQKDFRRLTV